MRNILLAAAAVSVIAAPAFAQTMQGPTYYGTLGYSQLDHSDGDLGAVTGRVGAKFKPDVARGVHGDRAGIRVAKSGRGRS